MSAKKGKASKRKAAAVTATPAAMDISSSSSSSDNKSNKKARTDAEFFFAVDKQSHKKPADLFDGDLSYGPAPESTAALNEWLDSHDRQFGDFINNEWHKPSGRSFRKSTCPATKEVLAETMESTAEDVNVAVSAAKKAQPAWAALAPHERAKHMYSIARHVQKHARILAVLEAMDNGKSFRETRDSDIPLVARHFYHYAGWAQLADTEMKGWAPVGVVAGIVPWNFPLMLLSWKVCPALAMGNTVVIKPASYTRLSCLLLAQIIAEAGLPKGVFNIVTGSGWVGSVMADHPDVDKVAFTGSTAIGRVLRRRMAGSGKKLSLELGGKSPIVVFDTADLDSAVEGVVDAIWFNQGQVCSGGSRLLIQENVYDKFIAKLKRRMDTFRIGHPLEKDIDMGALVDESQYKCISGFCERATAEGADVYTAKVNVPECGYYWPPTLITNVHTASECVRDEIFGPVVAAMTFRVPGEAVALANNTYYGLGASVWTENVSLALEVAIQIKAGTVWVNAHNLFDAASGFGGYRESGYGRDGGKEGLYDYVKPSWMPKRTTPEELKFPCEEIKWASKAPSQPASVESSNAANRMAPIGNGSIKIDHTRKMYIGGKQKRPDGNYSRPVLGPNKEMVDEVGDGNRKDIRDAVTAAAAAAGGWGKRAAHNRAQICYYIAENLQIRFAEFSGRLAAMTGRDVESCNAEVEMTIQRLFHWAAYADKYGGTVQETSFYGVTTKIHEPVGVVAIACPDEFPLLSFVSLIAPALVRGNTVVVVPSEAHPLCAVDLYQVFDTSDLPGGVVNIVTGNRDMLTQTLAEHNEVQSMWYFGSAKGSQCVEYVAGENMKRTWVNFGATRDWMDLHQGQGEEFLVQSVECKAIWIPFGEISGA